jgi:hypothetical protein
MPKTKKVHFRALKKRSKTPRRACGQKDSHFVYSVTNYVKKRGTRWFA